MYLLIADDLTGGNDAGIQFAKRGMPTQLALSATCLPTPGAGGWAGRMLACNTNTRNIPAQTAASRVAAFAASVKSAGASSPVMVFKKIDSTLRGNPGAEMDALMDGLGFAAAFLAPAYPQQGRTVVAGELLVNGVPLHQTGFANDPLTPVRESSIAAIIGAQSRRKTGLVPLSVCESGQEALVHHIRALYADGAECIVFDAQTPEHLAEIAEAGLSWNPRPLFMGAAGLAEALASRLPRDAFGHAPEEHRAPPAPVERVLFVCGSANQATHTQTHALAAAGVPVIHIPEDFQHTSTATVTELATALAKGSAVLAAPLERLGPAGDVATGAALAAAIASATLSVLRALPDVTHSTALVMTGGETAYAILEQLGDSLSLHAELLPGIALCTVNGGAWNGLRVITKAGGFGAPQTLVELITILRRRETL